MICSFPRGLRYDSTFLEQYVSQSDPSRRRCPSSPHTELPNLDELSFRIVLALPKDSRRGAASTRERPHHYYHRRGAQYFNRLGLAPPFTRNENGPLPSSTPRTLGRYRVGAGLALLLSVLSFEHHTTEPDGFTATTMSSPVLVRGPVSSWHQTPQYRSFAGGPRPRGLRLLLACSAAAASRRLLLFVIRHTGSLTKRRWPPRLTTSLPLCCGTVAGAHTKRSSWT